MTTEQLKPWAYKPQERAAAKAAGEVMYFTGRPCKQGHVTLRFTSSGSCHDCSLSYQKESRLNNIEDRKEKEKTIYANNRQKMVDRAKSYRMSNPEKLAEASKKWRIANRHVKTHNQQLRHASKKNATPAWLSKRDLALMLSFYRTAKEQQDLFGVPITVDHIAPLNGKTVCGLHVPWNLCLRTQSDNLKKSNKLSDDVYWPKQAGILVCESALPWNLKKELKNDYI
jgi:hypothetical protein